MLTLNEYDIPLYFAIHGLRTQSQTIYAVSPTVSAVSVA